MGEIKVSGDAERSEAERRTLNVATPAAQPRPPSMRTRADIERGSAEPNKECKIL
jgi:hypothetical protein